jgi:hypothetical protein
MLKYFHSKEQVSCVDEEWIVKVSTSSSQDQFNVYVKNHITQEEFQFDFYNHHEYEFLPEFIKARIRVCKKRLVRLLAA